MDGSGEWKWISERIPQTQSLINFYSRIKPRGSKYSVMVAVIINIVVIIIKMDSISINKGYSSINFNRIESNMDIFDYYIITANAAPLMVYPQHPLIRSTKRIKEF